MSVGTNVRRLRKAARLSSNALAQKAGLSNTRMIELGYRDVSMDSLKRLAAALGVTPAELITDPPRPRGRKAL